MRVFVRNLGGTPIILDLARIADIREKLTANRTYYVRADGSDSNDGLADTAAGAFLTIQKAIDVVGTLDLAGFGAVIQVRSGTYAAVALTKPFIGGLVTLQGDTTTPANVVISSSGHCIQVANHAVLAVAGFKLTSSGTFGLLASEGGVLNVTGNMEYGACSIAQICASSFGKLSIFANYSITGAAGNHFFATDSGYILCEGRTVTQSGTLAFGAYARSDVDAVLRCPGCTFSGGTITGTRFVVSANSVIATFGGGANYFPGNAAGVPATGGLYT
jgi:hypothetical protein